MMEGINSKLGFNNVYFKGETNNVVTNPTASNNNVALERQPEVDAFQKSDVENEGIQVEIGTIRLATGFLTDAQVAEINKTRKLPENAKFFSNGYGQYFIANNFFGMRAGTQTLPEGFEVKKNFMGQAIVVAKDTKGLLIR